jgi:hypothetical protein
MAVGPIYGSQPIGFGLFHWTLDLEPLIKSDLKLYFFLSILKLEEIIEAIVKQGPIFIWALHVI